MKLDRNINANRRGKYALLKLRKLNELAEPNDPFQEVDPAINAAIGVLEKAGILDWGNTPETDFFLIRLKDKYAPQTLARYAAQAAADDPEYAQEVMTLSHSAETNPFCKQPD